MAVDNRKALERAGFTITNLGLTLPDVAEMKRFEKAADASVVPKTAALLQSIGDSKLPDAIKEAMTTALGTKWKTDPNLFQKMEANFKANPRLSDQVQKMANSDPNKLIQAISAYDGNNLAKLMAPSPSSVTAPLPSSPSKTQAPAPAAGPTKSSRAPHAAPVTVSPVTIATPESPQKAPSAVPRQPETPATSAPSSDNNDMLTVLEMSSDADIKDIVDDKTTKQILDGIAGKASALGVNAASVDGFKKATGAAPLQKAITKNLQNNPEFVRQLAKMSKDSSTASEPFKSKALQEMNKLMSNPQLLADDKYVKGLQSQMQMAETLKKYGLDKMLGDMFGQSMGPLKSGFAELGFMLAGFGGQHPVLSMSKGSGFFPDIMINLQNFGRNQDEARAFSRYSPRDMTAYTPRGADGKFFHEVVSGKDANGKEIKTQVPNGQIALKTASGGEIKVIPSAGVLVAKQEAGAFDGSGKFIPGNFRVPVVTGVDEDGASSKIAMAVLTPAEFEKYKKIADAEARKGGGSIQELMVERYTAEDAHRLGKGPVVQVAKVDPVSGAVGPLTSVSAQTGQVRAPIVHQAGGDPAANDRDYQLQG